jgi:hypothetical protein
MILGAEQNHMLHDCFLLALFEIQPNFSPIFPILLF